MGWIKRPHVLQILKIWTHKLSLCFPQIRRDGRWDNAPHGSVQLCVFIRLNARQHTCGLSGKGLFLVHQKRDRENTTRLPTSRHVSYSSHIWYCFHLLVQYPFVWLWMGFFWTHFSSWLWCDLIKCCRVGVVTWHQLHIAIRVRNAMLVLLVETGRITWLLFFVWCHWIQAHLLSI